ncbi:MAG: hypothetical protein M3N08_06250 [Pseudomonadota bacterium]|nr:hypothetical protein [Pseudomonadota bacterium]
MRTSFLSVAFVASLLALLPPGTARAQTKAGTQQASLALELIHLKSVSLGVWEGDVIIRNTSALSTTLHLGTIVGNKSLPEQISLIAIGSDGASHRSNPGFGAPVSIGGYVGPWTIPLGAHTTYTNHMLWSLPVLQTGRYQFHIQFEGVDAKYADATGLMSTVPCWQGSVESVVVSANVD